MCQSHARNLFWVSKSYFSLRGGQLDHYMDKLLAPNSTGCFFWATQSRFYFSWWLFWTIVAGIMSPKQYWTLILSQ